MEEFTATLTCHNDLKEFKVNANLTEMNVIRQQTEKRTVGRHPKATQRNFWAPLEGHSHLIHHTSWKPSLPITTIPFSLLPVSRFHVLDHHERPHLLCALGVGLCWVKQVLHPGARGEEISPWGKSKLFLLGVALFPRVSRFGSDDRWGFVSLVLELFDTWKQIWTQWPKSSARLYPSMSAEALGCSSAKLTIGKRGRGFLPHLFACGWLCV